VVAGAWSNDCAASQDFNQPQPTHSSLFRVDGGECFGLPLMVGGSDSELVRISRAGSYFCGPVSLGLVGIDRLQAHPSRSRSLMYFPRHDFSPGGARTGTGPRPRHRFAGIATEERHCSRRPRGRSGLRVLGSPNLNDVDSATRPAATRGGDDHTSKSGVRAQRRLSPLRLRGTSLV
jgi:hypothetical protein